MQYMARIELHHADESTYERLHAQAPSEQYSRTLTDTASNLKFLAPTGTYWTTAYASSKDALDAAIRLARAVHPSFEVMVAGDGDIRFYNCQPLQPRLLAPRRTPSVFASLSTSTVPVPRGLPTLMDLSRSLTPPTSTVPVSSSLPPLSGLALLYEAMLKTK
jgi:hypothetical protein